MINTEQLYQEVKRVWKSVYPIYFDSTKTIAEGQPLLIQAVGSPNSSQSPNPLSKRYRTQWASAGARISLNPTRPTPETS